MPAESPRRLWLVSKERVGSFQMGPVVRLLGQAHTARAAGYEVTILCPSWSAPVLEGIDISKDLGDLLRTWRTGDPVVVDAYIPGRWLFRLLGSTIPFDADFYCVSMPEAAELFPEHPKAWQQRERIRRALKYAWIARSARRLYVSTLQQVLSLAGMLASGPDRTAPGFVGGLPGRCIEIPMGVRAGGSIPSTNWANPYPTNIHGRAIALWGGGIWPWFDMETLIHAFALLPDRDRGPVLFFLSGSNHRPDPRADEPVAKTKNLAIELGLLGRNVFFNTIAVSPDELAPWLQHATMGVLANPVSWEAMASWRTRYLDLLAHGVPLVVAGSDPLADRMVAAGAALAGPAENAEVLAENIQRLAQQLELRQKMSTAVLKIASELDEGAIGSRWIASLREDRWGPRPPASPTLLELLRFRLAWG